MSILGRFSVRQMLWRGSDDPALPEGIWWASGVQLGDASGGSQGVDLVFKEEGQPLSGDIFNLEELNAFVSTSTDLPATLTAVGMAPTQGSSFVDRQYGLVLQDLQSASGNSALRGGRGGSEGMLKLPTMLGTVRGDADSVGILRLAVENQTASNSLSVTAFGYRWGPRSILAEGGPQRPARSAFGG